MSGSDDLEAGAAIAAPGPEAAAGGGGLAAALAATRARPERPPSRRRRSRAKWIATGAAVVAILLLAGIVFGTFRVLLPGSSPSGTTPGPTSPSVGPTAFYAALVPASDAARAADWNGGGGNGPPLVFAEGFASPTALGPAVTAGQFGTSACSPHLLTDVLEDVPTFNGSLAAGTAPYWLFAFSTSASQLLAVIVVNGTASPVATISSDGQCYNGPSTFNAVVIDSSLAASTAAATNTSSGFLANESNASVSAEFFLAPPGFVSGAPPVPLWIITDTTCPLFGTAAGNGTSLTSLVEATTGTLYTQDVQATTC